MIVRVAVGVIVNNSAEVLIALRAKQQHQGGLWEFPGGKIEPNETEQQALYRELDEELGIIVAESTALTQITHNYGDKQVELNFILVTAFSGEPVGKEGQPIEWVNIAALDRYAFPAANQAVIPLLRKLDYSK